MSAQILRLSDYRARSRLRLAWSGNPPMARWYAEVDDAMRELLRVQERVNKRIIEAWCAGWIKWPT